MNSPASVQGVSAIHAVLGVVFIEGKLTGCRSFNSQNGRRWAHLIVMPAVDEYTSPSKVEIIATEKLGTVGEVLKQKCRVTGRPRSYTAKETGEVVQTAEMSLQAIL